MSQLEETDPTDLEAGTAAEARQAEATRQEQGQYVEDLKWIMGDAQGRRFMWRLLGITGAYRNPFAPGRDGTTEFLCGQQAIGQTLITEIHAHCYQRYAEMVKEQQRKKR